MTEICIINDGFLLVSFLFYCLILQRQTTTVYIKEVSIRFDKF